MPPTIRRARLTGSNRFLVCLAIVAIALLGTAARLPRIEEPPATYHPMRQYFSALIARDWLATVDGDDVDAPRSITSVARDDLIEPPVMEALSVAGFVVTGGQSWWLPRLLSSVIWAAAGVVLFLLGRRLQGTLTGLVAMGLVVLGPATTEAGRSFQPEALVLLATAGAALGLVSVLDSAAPGRRRQVAAGLLLGAAATLKLTAGLVLLPLSAGVLIDLRRRSSREGVGVIVAVAAIPVVLYYGYGFVGGGALGGQAGGRILPSLWNDGWYWHGWWHQACAVVPPVIGAVAIAGTALGPVRLRRVVLGLLAGYLLLGLTFTWHVASHSYYSLPLLLPTALGVGAAVSWVAQRVHRPGFRAVGVAALAGLALTGAGVEAHRSAGAPTAGQQHLITAALEADAAIPGPEDAWVVDVSQEYGAYLRWYADRPVTVWPNVYDLAQEKLAGHAHVPAAERMREATTHGERYLVLLDLLEPVRQPDLRALISEMQLVALGDGWHVYRLPDAYGSAPASSSPLRRRNAGHHSR